MKKLLVSLFVVSWFMVAGVRAEGCENIGNLNLQEIPGCISVYTETLNAIAKANTNNKQELSKFKSQITNLKLQIDSLNVRLDKLAKNIFDREVRVGVRKTLLAARVKRDYVRKRSESILMTLFASDSAQKFFRDVAYREKLANTDREEIGDVSQEIHNLNEQSVKLGEQKKNLNALKIKVDKQATFLAGEVAKAESYVSDLGGKIAALSARQQSLLAERTGVYSTTVGDVPLADDPNSRPSYNPGFSPAFAAFSFGAPHFRGMSQYGAFGRAKSGQDAETILHAYYGGLEIKKDYATNINIRVTGYGTVDIETYVKRIYEMPTSWGDQGGFEALKAQAVAARSYALAYTNSGSGSICATEACQVYKPANKGGKWEEAVNATRGWVLVANGKPFSAWYSSTSGGYQQSYTANGYTTPGFWDTTSDWTNWASGAYEVKGGSPWFYKGWYKSRSGLSCGRSHPWLTNDEFSDIVNAAIIIANNGDASGIFPLDNCSGQSGWSRDKMAGEADKFGGRVTNVSSVSVRHGSNGITNQVSLGTNRGEVVVSGTNFSKAFNLRAPGFLGIKGNLFNIEQK